MYPVIPFNRPRVPSLTTGGEASRQCAGWLEERVGGRALLTHSATGALEIAMMLAGVTRGSEVIMPSFTFVSTANAVALRGGVPVFVDVRHDTLNLDENAVEAAVTTRTRAVVAVHYAGVGCEMDELDRIAVKHGLAGIEDAAQGLGATYEGQPLGSLGDAAALSFHETKNVTCGEGGALIVNDSSWIDRAEVIQQKGTDRARFDRGEADRYTWQDLGSSYALGEIAAEYLRGQMQDFEVIQADRMRTWDTYHAAFEPLEHDGRLRRPVVPENCGHNAHIYYLLLPESSDRAAFLANLYARGVHAVFHFVPLHSSPAGLRYGRTHGELPVTDSVAARIVRLPLWAGMTEAMVENVVEAVEKCL